MVAFPGKAQEEGHQAQDPELHEDDDVPLGAPLSSDSSSSSTEWL
jgi:hypothetical protein